MGSFGDVPAWAIGAGGEILPPSGFAAPDLSLPELNAEVETLGRRVATIENTLATAISERDHEYGK